MTLAFFAFLAWSLLAVAFGMGLGRAIDYADAAEQPEQDPATAVLDWNNAPAEWLAR